MSLFACIKYVGHSIGNSTMAIAMRETAAQTERIIRSAALVSKYADALSIQLCGCTRISDFPGFDGHVFRPAGWGSRGNRVTKEDPLAKTATGLVIGASQDAFALRDAIRVVVASADDAPTVSWRAHLRILSVFSGSATGASQSNL